MSDGIELTVVDKLKAIGGYVDQAALEQIAVEDIVKAFDGKERKVKLAVAELNKVIDRYDELQVKLEDKEKEIDYLQSVIAEELEQTIVELKAHINVLLEALEVAKYELEMQGCNEPYADENSLLSYNMVIQTLATTPAQSLAKHDNEVIEKCAKVCAVIAEQVTGHTIIFNSFDAIRELKGNSISL